MVWNRRGDQSTIWNQAPQSQKHTWSLSKTRVSVTPTNSFSPGFQNVPCYLSNREKQLWWRERWQQAEVWKPLERDTAWPWNWNADSKKTSLPETEPSVACLHIILCQCGSCATAWQQIPEGTGMIPNVPCAVTIRQHHDDHINETSEASSLVETSSLSESKLRQLFLEPKIINIIF